MRKKIIIILLMLLTITICIVSLINKKLNLNSNINKNEFAIMLKDENNEYVKYDRIDWPSITEGYVLNREKSHCQNNEEIKWIGTTFIMESNKEYKCYLYFDKIKYTYNFDYKAEAQEFIAPETGKYIIELWGSQGGDSAAYYGGKGAYTIGMINLEKDEKLYIYTGEQGHPANENYNGTFNGGAEVGLHSRAGEIWGGTGGGATDIRLVKGNWNDFEGLKSRIMVAAAGGGASSRGYEYGSANGGAGGTLHGLDGDIKDYSGNYQRGIGMGATQVSGGISNWYNSAGKNTGYLDVSGFGYSGAIYALSDCRQDCEKQVSNNKNNLFAWSNQSGGGSGYYGGGSAVHGSSAGGSSYISGYKGCVAIKQESTEKDIQSIDGCADGTTNITCSYHYSGKIFTGTLMIAGNSQMPSPNGEIETGHSGNGYARITLIE